MFPTPHILMFVGMVLIHIFGMPWLMLDSPGHYRISRGQIYMAIAMGLSMIFLEGLMHPMPKWAWIATSALLGITIVLIRTQWGITDVDYLREMIPHHSMALFTSQHRLKDPRVHPTVQALADQIVRTQKAEIQIMDRLITKMSALKPTAVTDVSKVEKY